MIPPMVPLLHHVDSGATVSVVLVNWNTKELLRNCLESLLANAAVPLEVFVVDNGSSDGSPEMVESDFAGVDLIRNRENLGFGKAVNLGMARATGPVVMLLNTDTIVPPDSVRTVQDYLEMTPDAAVVGVQLLNADGSRQNSIANFPTLLTELGNKSLLRKLFPARYPGKEREFPGPVEVESVIGACMFVRREAIEKVGPLDEDFFFFMEETDWCLRFREAGWRVVHHPGATVVHLQGKTAEKVNVRARIEYYRSRYTYFRKHGGPAGRFALRAGLMFKVTLDLLAHLVMAAATGGRNRRITNRLAVYWKLFLWHAAGCPASWGLAPR